MGGGGSISHMTSSLKNNKALRSNKNYFLLKSEYLKTAKKRNIDLKSASPEQLKQIRKELELHNKKQKQKKF